MESQIQQKVSSWSIYYVCKLKNRKTNFTEFSFRRYKVRKTSYDTILRKENVVHVLFQETWLKKKGKSCKILCHQLKIWDLVFFLPSTLSFLSNSFCSYITVWHHDQCRYQQDLEEPEKESNILRSFPTLNELEYQYSTLACPPSSPNLAKNIKSRGFPIQELFHK